jgi:uncharacterized integral membrane protein
MLSKTPGAPLRSPEPGAIADTIERPSGNIERPSGNGSTVAGDPDGLSAQASTATTIGIETRAERLRRLVHRTRLHGYAIATAALIVYLIALAASNTAHVTVHWVFGTSHVSLVWLVLFVAILGWLLGLAITARVRWRTRAPRRGGARS